MSATFLPDLVTAALLDYTYLGTITSNTTTKGDAVDCLDVDGPIYAVVITGDVGDASTTVQVKLQESVDTTDGNFGDITGATHTLSGSATANDKLAYFVKEDGNRSKRYVRAVVVTASGSSISVPIAIAILGRKKITGSGNGAYTGF